MPPADELPPQKIPYVGLKAGLLVVLTAALIAGFAGYVLYARGVFEPTQTLYLIADNAEGLSVGSDLTFSGFPIGRVRRIELTAQGKARVEVEVPRSDAHWLRDISVFTLERGLVGPARLRAFTGDLESKPLADGATRPLLRGDATDELPLLLANARQALANLERMSAPDSSLNEALADLRKVTASMTGRYGVLGGLLGGDENAEQLMDSIERANALLASLGQTVERSERLLARADERLFAPGGIADGTREALAQLNATLGEARTALKKADAVLADAQRISANTRAATEDLAALRAENEASLRKAGALIDEINRRWPFARDTEVKLP
jgi:phospholipid/cholesterol/gamma-HCH transport system substrate-binding protein